MKFIIHCGTYKTGTTYIQNVLHHNREQLLSNGILYPCTGIDNSSNNKNGEIGMRHAQLAYGHRGKNQNELFKSLNGEIKTSQCHTVIISSEAWSRPDTLDGLKILLKNFRENFKNTEIAGIIAFRNIYSYMISHYREWVRRYGYHLGIEDYVVSRKDFFNYKKISNELSNIFNGNVTFHSYEDNKNILDAITTESKCSTKLRKPDIEINKSPSCLDVEIIRILNMYGMRSKNPPGAEKIFKEYGISIEKEYNERIPGYFYTAYSDEYIKDFKNLTGMNEKHISNIFKHPDKTYEDIFKISPVLERTLFEWLKLPNQQKASHGN